MASIPAAELATPVMTSTPVMNPQALETRRAHVALFNTPITFVPIPPVAYRFIATTLSYSPAPLIMAPKTPIRGAATELITTMMGVSIVMIRTALVRASVPAPAVVRAMSVMRGEMDSTWIGVPTPVRDAPKTM